MKRVLLIASLIFVVAFDASAQQRPPTDLPKPTNPLPPMRYPAPAATYEHYVQYWLQLIRSIPSRYNVPAGDVNKVILTVKDCTARIESDGVVTRDEARMCRVQAMAQLHELATPYMIQFAAEN